MMGSIDQMVDPCSETKQPILEVKTRNFAVFALRGVTIETVAFLAYTPWGFRRSFPTVACI